ncbi:glutamate synthase (NADPH/NADH) large chain [Bryocella elongata]|uniref:Glutamate synthase (NADPH/NADH) large chain n=1 Tax=Bryocella elongata TaxID=863522 RepID=A0A1H6B451_9BACT|nr:glutamate synthase-related protein [Bryocella elongata]SEG55608.1 glutamate synthase (NADPH/NADH) large chain [Bryocella elongata]
MALSSSQRQGSDPEGWTPEQQSLSAASVAVAAPRSLAPKSLIDSRFDHDSCGVGFVAQKDFQASYTILQHALTALSRLEHRGAVASDGASSDGIGVMVAVPRALLLKETGIQLADNEALGLGMIFLPAAETRAEAVIEESLAAQQLKVLCWRDVPTRPEILGEIALSTMPKIRQVLVADASGRPFTFNPNPQAEEYTDSIERRLYLARKQFERAVDLGETEGYICSLSVQTVVYKAMCLGRLLPAFFPDLENPEFVTPFAVFHQRYATNTLPAWHRAQPGRKLGHNGEINTVWGNRSRMLARDATLPVECKPVLTKDGTDSTSLDETIELISQNGRTIAEAIRMLLPPAGSVRHDGNESPFLSYSTGCSEPWDGPAALAFSDGIVVGAALDRNGLRPCRYAITSDGVVVAGSEAGLVDLDPDKIIESGRLGPGEMLGVDMAEGRIYHNDAMLDAFDAKAPYATLIERTPLAPVEKPELASNLAELQKGFGYTKEDLKMILQPMAATGKDAVWSMGDDTPLAFLAKSPRPLYAYFRQRFAQVTNPPIDSLREAIVVKLSTRFGPWAHLLDKNAPLPGISLDSPFLSRGQMQAIRAGEYPHASELRLEEVSCLFAPEKNLEQAVDDLRAKSVELVRNGAKLLILTDRGASAQAMPIPMAMATGAVHEALVEAGMRTLCGIAVEAGDCRDIHHAAIILSYGAGAVCPWLALETAASFAGEKGFPENTDGEKQLLKSLDAGLAKIMSKMGISVVDSYRGTHLFDILGLHQSIIAKCFPRTPAPLSGIGFAELDRRLRESWGATPGESAAIDLPDYGWVRFRKSDTAEPHAWQPPTVKALQTVVGSARGAAQASDPSAAFQIYSRNMDVGEAKHLRDLLEIRPAGAELALERVEGPDSLCTKFIASAMSLGSLSPEAHQTITAAMNMLGARSNTGEGGEDPAVYRPQGSGSRVQGPDGGDLVAAHAGSGGAAVAEVVAAPAVHTSLNNKIKQIASGRFGVTAEYLAHAEEIEIKVAQGAKPGEGGQLPGHKVSGLIARLRHAQPGVSLISPPPHHDIYSIEDLAQLIYDLKRVNKSAAVGVKLVSEFGVGTVAAGVAKAYADYIVIAGHGGGTGAAALSSIKYAGSPWELGLSESQQVLRANGMRERVRLRADGGISTARDVLVAALLGADEFAFGTSVLVALGCDMARQCHLNTCPTGIATQREDLRAKFRGKPEHVVTFFKQLAGDLQRLLAKFGLPSLEAATGRVDLLEQVRFDGNIDLTPVLANGHGEAWHGSPARWGGGLNKRPGEDHPLDDPWTAPALEAVAKGEPFHVKSHITNEHRSVGARLSGELALLRAKGQVDKADVTFELEGTAGQSFGAFTAAGVKLILTGQANDFVGKGLSGGELVLRAVGLAAEDSHDHVLLGNVALYGATAGKLFAAGRAGERFAVRNSGVTAVIEGIGDHGCEYMTGGMAVILGEVGINFGAGMTGGLAWVYDKAGTMVSGTRYHDEFLGAQSYAETTEAQQATLYSLVQQQESLAHSKLAMRLLSNWAEESAKFVLFTPKPQ